MFTPQRKVWPAVPLTPRTEAKGVGSNYSLREGKGVALAGSPPPPLDSLADGLDISTTFLDNGNIDDWRQFKNAGLLDMAAMERKDREALVEKASRLQNELFDYQHNLGLILIEKKEWASKYDELGQDVAEAEEILKREQSTHSIVLSEVETRIENLKNTLAAEKQHVASLKKALFEVTEEHAQIKLTSQKKLTDANALMHGIEEKSLELQKNLDAAEAKLAEVNRKSSELEMRMHEAEVRESVLRTEQMSLVTEQEVYQATSQKDREGICKWEQKLQEWEERLSKTHELINDREKKVKENDITMKQKENDLEYLKKKIDFSGSVLKEREEDVNRQLEDVIAKEKEADFIRSRLSTKQEDLHQMEENLHAREMMEMEQLLDEQRAILQRKRKEFDLELVQRRQFLDNEFSTRIDELQRKEIEIDHEKEKLTKQEQALENKMVRGKEKEGDLEQKVKALKAKDRLLRADEKKLDAVRQQMLADRESLQSLISEIEEMRAENSQKELHIHEEREKLWVTKEERSEHVRLHCQLMQEIDSYRLQYRVVMKEHDDLKEERLKFERDCAVLDEKRAEISKELSDLVEERRQLEILQQTEGERLKKEKNELQTYMHRELDSVTQDKELFFLTIENEQQALSEKAQIEHKQLLQDIELKKKDFESHLQNRQEELAKKLQIRELAFEEEKGREQNNIFCLKEIAQKEMEDLSSDRHELKKDKAVVFLNRQQLKTAHSEICQDIDKLNILSKKLKIQRERLVQDRYRFLAFVDKHKSCVNCGFSTEEFMVPELQLPEEFKEPNPLAKLDNKSIVNFQETLDSFDFGSSSSEGHMSWLRRCSTKIFKLSPLSKMRHVIPPASTELAVQINTDLQFKKPGVHVNDVKGPAIANEPQPSLSNENEPSDVQRLSASDDILNSKAEKVSEGSIQPDLKRGKQKHEREQMAGLHRTRSVKAAVEDAKVFLGEVGGQSDFNVLVQTNDISSLDKGGHNLRKRQRVESSGVSVSEQGANDSEGYSDSVTGGRQRKRRQKVAPSMQTQGGKRYNLRRHKTAGKASATPSSANQMKNEIATSEKVEPNVEAFPSSSVNGENDRTTNLVQITTVSTIALNEDKRVRFKSLRTSDEDNASMEKSVAEDDLHQEVNGSSGYEDEDASTVNDEDEYDEEQRDPASIGKKIWTFFTT